MISWIDSLEAINGKGDLIKVSKSDLSDFVGMEGTTGMITQAVLRLTNKKQKSITILKANTLQDVFIANKKLRLKQDVVSIDLVNKEISSLLGLENKYHLFIESENLEGTFKGENYEKFHKLKNSAYKKAANEGYYYMGNVKLLIDSLQDFLIYLDEKKILYFAHLASGTVFPLFRPEEIGKMEETLRFAKKLRAKIAYNFGIGLTKKDALEIGEIELIKRVKNRQDPQWKMNRDKLIDHRLMNSEIKNKNEELLEKPEQSKINLEKNEIPKENSNPTGEQSIMLPQRKKEELSPEEKEKIKKIAGGFFGGVKKEDKK
jgi:FAD/FMN-containing dehydrogenase